MTGIYWLMGNVPMWVWAVTLYMLFVIRDWREGMPYNISVSSQQGDLALIGVILIGVEIVRNHPRLLSGLDDLQWAWLVVGVAIGVGWQSDVILRSRRWGTAADAYHNLIAVPTLVFLLGVTTPVVYLYSPPAWQVCALLFFSVWLGTFLFDKRRRRLQQTEWLRKKGVHLPLKP